MDKVIPALTSADAIEYAAILSQSDKGHEVDPTDLINALTWRCANQRREIHKLHLRIACLERNAVSTGANHGATENPNADSRTVRG
jgi:hypothetical protein